MNYILTFLSNSSNIIAGSVIGAAIGTLAVSFFQSIISEKVKEWFALRMMDIKEKRQYAGNIVKILTEGEKDVWNTHGKNYEKGFEVAGHIDLINKNLADDLRTYLGRWAIHELIHRKPNPTQDDIKLIKELEQDLVELGEILRSGAKRIRA